MHKLFVGFGFGRASAIVWLHESLVIYLEIMILNENEKKSRNFHGLWFSKMAVKEFYLLPIWPCPSSMNARWPRWSNKCAVRIQYLNCSTTSWTIEHQTMVLCSQSAETALQRTHNSRAMNVRWHKLHRTFYYNIFTIFFHLFIVAGTKTGQENVASEWMGWLTFRSNCIYYFNITDNVQFPFLVRKRAQQTTIQLQMQRHRAGLSLYYFQIHFLFLLPII